VIVVLFLHFLHILAIIFHFNKTADFCIILQKSAVKTISGSPHTAWA
jgi:hypothetical protein